MNLTVVVVVSFEPFYSLVLMTSETVLTRVDAVMSSG